MAKINSKDKGNRVELELAKILTERFGQEFKRVPMSGAWGTRNREFQVREDAMQILSGDIMCPENFKFSVESKGRIDFNFWDMLNAETKNLDIDEWIFQAIRYDRIAHWLSHRSGRICATHSKIATKSVHLRQLRGTARSDSCSE